MKEIASNSPIGSILGYRFRQTVPSLILLIPYFQYQWVDDFRINNDNVYKIFLVIILFAFVLSFLTEMLGDWLEGMIFSSLSKKNDFRNSQDMVDRSVVDTWFEYLNRSLDDKRIADLYISGKVDKLRMQCSMPAPILIAAVGLIFVVDTSCFGYFKIICTSLLFIALFIFFAFETMKELIKLRDYMMSNKPG